MTLSKRRLGLTLIEVLIAASILGLGLIPIVDLVLRNGRRTQFSSDRLIATMRAHTVLERFRALGPFRLASKFPGNKPHQPDVAGDPLLSLPPDPTTSSPFALAVELPEEERTRAGQRDARFPAEVQWKPGPAQGSGLLEVRVSWTHVNDSTRVQTVVAREWLRERK